LHFSIIQVGALNGIAAVIFFIGKFVLSGGAAIVAYLWVDIAYPDSTNSPIYPMAIVAIMVYLPAAKIMNIVDTAAEVLLVCFITDKEMHNGHAPYARGALGDWINKANNMEHSGKPGYDSVAKS
jgi:hypothetical protein